jgi:hypothetical protein
MLVVCCAATLTSISSPASAQGKKPKKPPVFKNPGYIHKTMSLQPGHRYRIQVTARTKVLVYGAGFEDYSWVNNNRLGESTKPFRFKGTTPRSFVLTQPVKGTLRSWIVGFTVQDTNLRPLNVRVVDLGKHK